jgi:hypothetical protein
MKHVWLLVIFVSGFLFASPQGAPGGKIDGIVTQLPSGRPAVGVRVLLHRFRSGAGPDTYATTDESGRFRFDAVAAGDIQIGVAKNRVEIGDDKRAVFSRAGVAGGPVFLTMVPDQRVEDVSLFLTAGSTVSGRILMANRQPAINASVEVLRPAYYFGGRCVVETIASSRTDDRGIYRISGVEPGSHYVRGSWYGSVGFFPGVVDHSRAEAVEVLEGRDRDRIDFALQEAVRTSISGLIDLDRRPDRPSFFRLEARRVDGCDSGALVSYERTLTDFTGNFRGDRGKYELIAFVAPTSSGIDMLRQTQPPSDSLTRPLVAGSLSRATNLTHIGRVRMAHPGQDLDGLRIKMQALDPLNVRVRVAEGSERIALAPLRAALINPGFFDSGRPLDPAGAFEIPVRGDGKQYLIIEGFSGNEFVSDIRVEDASIYDEGIDLAKVNNSFIDVVLDSRGGQVQGKVSNSAGSYATVVLAPAERTGNPALYKAVTTDRNGAFLFRGVMPGDYRLFAWQSVPEFAWHNRDFMARFSHLGTSVRVGPASRSELIALPLIHDH